MIGSLIEHCLRRERPSLLASLYRFSGDLALAEEALQDASVQALKTWPGTGPPERPGAWLFVVAKRRLIDRLRQRKRFETPFDAGEHEEGGGDDAPVEGSAQDREDRLRLLFACCSVGIPERARIALALRSLLGLTTREIARAFLEPEATTAKRIARAKTVLQTLPPGHDTPDGEARAASIAVVLRTLYLVFNEGYLAAEGPLQRHALVDDAIGLCEATIELLPWHAEAHGLLALMLLHASRRPARLVTVGASEEMVTLDRQDRSLWDRAMIARGKALLDRALALRAEGDVGPYQVQAAIAALHCLAKSSADTDWLQIAVLYRLLMNVDPSPVVELNAAVAVAMSGNLTNALAWVNDLEKRGVMADYHLLPAVKGQLLERAGHQKEANRCYRRARRLTANEHERRLLTRRIADTDVAAIANDVANEIGAAVDDEDG